MNPRALHRKAWHGGQLLAFSGLDGATDYESGLTARTSFDAPGLDIMLPASCRVRFTGVDGGSGTVAGDWIQLDGDPTPLRGVFLDAHHCLFEGPCEVIDASPSIACTKSGRRTLIGTAAHFHADRIGADLPAAIEARKRWLHGVDGACFRSAGSHRTVAKALSLMKTQVCAPEGQIHHRWTTPDRWPHRQMWLWDSVFHAIGWRHVDAAMARDAISAVLDMQQADGFVAHMMSPQKISAITQPPVLALGARLVNDIAPSETWVKALYPRLCAYIEWDMAHRDSDGNGLLEWFIEGDPCCRSGESGMDNSPRFDRATQMDAVDFNAFLALECEVLAGFAASLGLNAEAAAWNGHHARLCRLIEDRLWSDESQFYVDYDLVGKAHSPVLASSGFLPLICGAASKERARILAAHLADPEMFGTAFPIPSIAAKDVRHYAKDMWRGPAWINLNWLVAMGFDRYDMHDVAARLRERTIAEIERFTEKHGVFFEFYDDRGEVEPPALLRKGKCAPRESPMHQVFHDYGWTATLYLDLAATKS